MIDSIGTYAPPAPAPRLYAHGGVGTRRFLYEHDEPGVIKIQLGPQPDADIRWALDAAVDRINALHRGLSARFCAHCDLAPRERAAVGAIMAIFSIAPRIPAQIFPLPGGGLQIEWHHGHLDIEIECLTDGTVYVYLANQEGTLIDEQASGRRAQTLLAKVREALASATAGYGGGLDVLVR